MTYADFFSIIKGKFMEADVSEIHDHLAFQFNIENPECGGIFYVEVKDGKLYVEPYEYYDRDAIFTCTPDILLQLSEAAIDPVAAFFDQKLKVEGNFDKALRLKEIIELNQKTQQEKGRLQKTADKLIKKAAQKMSE